MPRCVLQAIPRGWRKGSSPFCVVLNQCLEQVGGPSGPEQTLPGTLGQVAACQGPGPGQRSPWGMPCWELGFPQGESPKFNYLKASHLWLLRTAQTSWPVFVGYKSEHLLTNHHHAGFERIPFPRSLLNPDQGWVRLLLPLAGTTVPVAWQQPHSLWHEAPRWVTGDALP